MTPVRHVLTLSDLEVEELKAIFHEAIELKKAYKNGVREKLLDGKVLGMIFEKMSLRTRVSFEAGINHLGGSAMLLEDHHVGIGKREAIKDVARVLSSMVDCVVYRGKRHEIVQEFASWSSVPVINALTDKSHPCQALADMLTIYEEFGSFNDVKIAWVGDSNNVSASLVEAAAMLGVQIALSSPVGYHFSKEEFEELTRLRQPGFELSLHLDPIEAVRGARVVYTDVWVSMGEPDEVWAERIRDLMPYQVNAELMAAAGPQAVFMHCLPSFHDLNTGIGREMYRKYGVTAMEVTDDVFEGPQSIVFDEAENRMHTIKAVMAATL